MNKKKAKTIYRNVGLGLTALCFVLSFFYRPYAYSHHLNDFHLADCYTSFFGIPIIVCLTQAFWQKEGEKWSIPTNIIYAVLLLFIWELVDGLETEIFIISPTSCKSPPDTLGPSRRRSIVPCCQCRGQQRPPHPWRIPARQSLNERDCYRRYAQETVPHQER